MPHLDYVTWDGADAGRLELADAKVRIGRAPPPVNDLQLVEHYCGRTQLILSRDVDGGYWLELVPPQERHPTILNGKLLPFGERRRLRDGDVIRVAGSQLVYHE